MKHEKSKKKKLDLTLYGNSISVYNIAAITEDRATLGSDPSAVMTAYSIGRYLV